MASKVVKINKSNTLLMVLLVCAICVVFGATVIAFSRAAPRNKNNIKTTNGPAFGLYTNPQSITTPVGSQVSYTVSANLANNPVQAISVFLHYDPTFLRLDSVDQVGVDPKYTVTSRCSSLDGCKNPGEIVLVAGYSGSGTIQPKNSVLVGNLKFTNLKTGNTSITIDPDTKLSGFGSSTTPQSTLDSRQISNTTVTIVRKKGH